MDVNEEFRMRLEVEMLAQGLNPATLAAKAGLNHMAVRDLLKGRAISPKLSTAYALAEALGVTLDELTGKKPQASVAPTMALILQKYSREEQQMLAEAIMRLPRSFRELE